VTANRIQHRKLAPAFSLPPSEPEKTGKHFFKGFFMANSYTSTPIQIDVTFTDGWRAHQTVYGGTVQPGFRVLKVVWNAPGASASFSIQETSDSMILLQGNTPTGFVGQDVEYDLEDMNVLWRNFKTPILSAGVLLIYPRY